MPAEKQEREHTNARKGKKLNNIIGSSFIYSKYKDYAKLFMVSVNHSY